jgi:tRNA-splicing ligase RtcB
MSRTAARNGKTSKEVYAEMASLGVALHSGDLATVAEKAPFAYKDIETVMAASTSLVRATKRLTPLGLVKRGNRETPQDNDAGSPGRRQSYFPMR